jgi:hypothetical protein
MDAIIHDGMDVDVDMNHDEQEHDRAGVGLKLPVSTIVRSSSPASLPPSPPISL